MSGDFEPMLRVSKSNPCPVCGKPDWCLVAKDGSAAICKRVEENSKKMCGDAGWLHILRERPFSGTYRRHYTKKISCNNDEALPHVQTLDYEYRKTIKLEWVNGLAHALGLSSANLIRMGVGWDGQAFTFPMRNRNEIVTGFRRRFSDGSKASMKGSRSGLFIPEQLDMNRTILICEGPTDTAAALDLGFEAIGRPNCNSLVDMTAEFLKGRNVVVVSDNDKPGMEGAYKLAEKLFLYCVSVKMITPPEGIKDIRQWLNSGLKPEDFTNTIFKADYFFEQGGKYEFCISNTRFSTGKERQYQRDTLNC